MQIKRYRIQTKVSEYKWRVVQYKLKDRVLQGLTCQLIFFFVKVTFIEGYV